MKAVTKRNFKDWVERNLDLFPVGFEFEDFNNFTSSLKDALFKKLGSIIYKPAFDYSIHNMTKSDFNTIDKQGIQFSTSIMNRMKKVVDQRLENEKHELKKKEPAPQWFEISTVMQNNFKRWLSHQTKKYDERFSVTLFDSLPDHIKVDFYFTLAKKFGIDNYYDLKTFKRSTNSLVMGVKNLKISDEIQEAIYDVIPLDGLMQTIKASDTDGTWSAKTNSEIAKGISQEEIDAARENRKADKKMAKLKARVKSMTSLAQYKVTLSDPLFDRGMMETILNRMEKQTAFKDTWYDESSKEIMELIFNHPLITTNDLLRINKMKSNIWGGGSQQIYNSKHLNSVLAEKEDLSTDELMKLIKKQQYDIKVKAAKRKDLSEADRNVLIEYSIKHHSHMPEQLREIFNELGEDINDYKDEIISVVKKKYTKGNNWTTAPTGIKLLEVIDTYDWMSELTDKDKEDMAKVLVNAYNKGVVSKERLTKVLNNLGGGMEFLTKLYDETGDEDFLPEVAKDLFLF